MLRRSHALALSVVLGAGSALGLHAAGGQTRPPTLVHVEAVTYAVSATQTLGAADLRVVDLPPRAVPAGAVRVLSQAEGRTTAVAARSRGDARGAAVGGDVLPGGQLGVSG